MAWIVKSGVLSTSFLVFCCFDIKNPTASVGCSLLSQGGEGGGALMSLAPWEEARQPVVATQDGGLELVWPGWPPGCCFPTASRARSQVIMPVEAGAGSECSGDSNTVAVNGRVDFPKKKLPYQCPGSALGRPGWRGMPSPGYSALPQELLLEVEPRRRR